MKKSFIAALLTAVLPASALLAAAGTLEIRPVPEKILNLRQLADGSMTMVIVTHEMQFAREVSDYVLFMDDGLVVEQGTPDEVIGNPKNERTKAFLARMHNGAAEEIV